jgi:hypothetical protein
LQFVPGYKWDEVQGAKVVDAVVVAVVVAAVGPGGGVTEVGHLQLAGRSHDCLASLNNKVEGHGLRFHTPEIH